MYRDFNELSNNVIATQKTLVVAAAHDSHTLEAVFDAANEYCMRFILVGNRERIVSMSSVLGVSVTPETIVDCDCDAECAERAVDLIKQGCGDALMKGLVDTGTLLKAVLCKEMGIRGSGILSHLAILEAPSYHKLIGVTDGGMIPNPTVAQKAGIAINSADFFRSIGYEMPMIAALCASENVSPKMEETVDAAELQAMCKRGELGICLLEGPLSFDLAISKESALIKGFSSEISGNTDVLLVPNITVGNVLVKGLRYWADAKMAGCIIGAKVPIVLTSRGASAEEKLLSILLSIL